MKIIIYLTLVVTPFFSFSQTINKQAHGTIIGVVICRDGILMASDSRLSFIMNTNGIEKPIAYTSNLKKICRIGKFYIAVAGTNSYNDRCINFLIKKYNRTHRYKESITTTCKDFMAYLNSINISDSMFGKTMFLLGGYENNKPVIIGKDTGSNYITPECGSLECRIFSSEGFKPFFNSNGILNDSFTCKEVAKKLDSLFIEFAINTGDSMIGKPLYIIRIKPNNKIETLETYKFRKYKKYSDFERDIYEKKIPITYIYPWANPYLNRTFINWKKDRR